MKVTVLVQGWAGSAAAPASEASAFLVRGVALNDQEISVRRASIDITPGGLLTVNLEAIQQVGAGAVDVAALDVLWPVAEGSLAGSPVEVEFREVPT